MPRLDVYTLTGLGAVALWSLLALLTAMSGKVPAFQLVAMTFAIGGLTILTVAALRGRLHLARPTKTSFALGVYGPFGDTAVYFAALKLAPPAEANLIHYLWPLLIVLFASLLPGGRLQGRHLVGALIGLGAVALLVAGRFGEAASATAWLGYALAALGAVIWASYSVMSRLVAGVPTESVGVTTLGCAVLALLCHLAFETTVWPSGWVEWVGVIGLGLGPIGLAFLCWDIGMKKGDIAFLGVSAYAAPVVSTITLVLAGYAPATWIILVSCLLIVAGALIASRPATSGSSG